MTTKKKELDVDIIGGSEPLTKAEEKRISDIIKNRKIKEKVTVESSKTKTSD